MKFNKLILARAGAAEAGVARAQPPFFDGAHFPVTSMDINTQNADEDIDPKESLERMLQALPALRRDTDLRPYLTAAGISRFAPAVMVRPMPGCPRIYAIFDRSKSALVTEVMAEIKRKVVELSFVLNMEFSNVLHVKYAGLRRVEIAYQPDADDPIGEEHIGKDITLHGERGWISHGGDRGRVSRGLAAKERVRVEDGVDALTDEEWSEFLKDGADALNLDEA